MSGAVHLEQHNQHQAWNNAHLAAHIHAANLESFAAGPIAPPALQHYGAAAGTMAGVYDAGRPQWAGLSATPVGWDF